MAATEVILNKSRARYVKRSGLPERFAGTFLNDLDIDPAVQAQCEALIVRQVEHLPPYGKGLILWGGAGRGKTTIACATLAEALCRIPRESLGKCFDSDAQRPGWYSTYARLVKTHKDSWDKNLEDEVREDATELLRDLYYENRTRDYWNTRLLVLDDVGKEHTGPSGFTVATLHDLLRSRYDASAPTIITTNLKPVEWKDQYGDAMGSFIHEAFTLVNVGGRDRR